MEPVNQNALGALLLARAPDPTVDIRDAFALIAVEQWNDNLAQLVIHALTVSNPILSLPPKIELVADFEDLIEVRRDDESGNGPVQSLLFFPDAPAQIELPRLVAALAIAIDEVAGALESDE